MSEEKYGSEKKSFLLLLKMDSTRLYEKIHKRMEEYIGIFAVKRTRAHFPDIFKNMYSTASFSDLKMCEQDTIIAANDFYNKADDIFWYLKHTEDMPNTLEDKLRHDIKDLSRRYNTLQLLLDAELGYQVE